jgi:uncharacterized protein
MMIKTKYLSYSTGRLPKGCRLCVQGRKTVVFITGICPKLCFYCPISEQKKNKDVIYINEWPTRKTKDLLKEIRLCSSKGAGITGGDPLARLSRTVKYIRLMKQKFGGNFHIHLYTPLDLVDKRKLSILYKAGLDEIRFHPDLNKLEEWHRILFANKFDWDIGIEIPVIPGMEKKTKRLIDFAANHIDFLNLNELEISDTNAQHLIEKGFRSKNQLSYGVKGSEMLAKNLLKYAENKGKNKGIRTHYCTAQLKDGVQLAKRLKLRARNAKSVFDYVTKEGMLVRAALYPKYSKTITLKSTARLLNKKEIFNSIDFTRKRLLFSVDDARLHRKWLLEIGDLRIVEEYPTYDCFSVQSGPFPNEDKVI